MTDKLISPRHGLIQSTADVVSAYVACNAVPTHELPSLIKSVHAALQLDGPAPTLEAETAPLPAISIKKSIQPDHLVCLECGLHFASLKRHLLAQHQLTPEDYRRRWDLNVSYPMVSSNYSKLRSQLAKSRDLGKRARKGR